MGERGRSRKKQNRRKKKPVLVSFAAAVTAVIAIVSAVTALRGRDTYKTDQSVYTCINGAVFQWEQGANLLHTKEGTTLREGKDRQKIERYPLIGTEDGSIIMQRSGSWNRTEDESFLRVDYFTVISRDEQGVVIRRDKKERRDISGFIYDNEDTYIFLEPVTLSYNQQTVELEPLTIVQANYMGSIQIFGPHMEPLFEYLTEEEVRAQFADGKRVNLATDTYFKKNGEWRLLFMPLEALQSIE